MTVKDIMIADARAWLEKYRASPTATAIDEPRSIDWVGQRISVLVDELDRLSTAIGNESADGTKLVNETYRALREEETKREACEAQIREVTSSRDWFAEENKRLKHENSGLRKELGELVETTLAEAKIATGAPLYDAGYIDCARGFADAVEALLAKGGGK